MAAYPHGLHKTDRQGRPVLVYMLGNTNLEALKAATSESRLQLLHIHGKEHIMRSVLPACSVLAGRHVEQMVTLVGDGAEVCGVDTRSTHYSSVLVFGS